MSLSLSQRLPVYGQLRYGHWRRHSFWVNLLWWSLLLGVIAWQSWLGWFYNSNETTNGVLVVGRIAAYNLLVLMALLWLPVMRHSMTWLRARGAAAWLPLDQMKQIHRWLGHALFAGAMVHGVAYLVYFDTLEGDWLPIVLGEEADLVRSMKTTMYEFVSEDESIDVVQAWVDEGWSQQMYEEDIAPLMKEDCTKCHSSDSTMTYAIPSLPLTDYESVKSLSQEGVASRQFRINMSGLIMLVLFLLVWASSLAVLRKRYYSVFQSLHRFGYGLAILALLHIPRLEYVLAPAFLLLFEYALNRTARGWKGCSGRLRVVGAQTVALTITLPKAVNIKPGHYVQIRLRSLHRSEWHSLSLTHGEGRTQTLNLLIKQLGDWTGELLTYAQTHTQITVDVRGPYASPMAEAMKGQDALCIAGGIGITPVLSLIPGTLSAGQAMQVVWVAQDWHLLADVAPSLRTLQQDYPALKVRCFMTTARPADMALPEGLSISERRPCLASKVEQFESRAATRPHAFVCGPHSLSESVRALLHERPHWRLSVEHF